MLNLIITVVIVSFVVYIWPAQTKMVANKVVEITKRIPYLGEYVKKFTDKQKPVDPPSE